MWLPILAFVSVSQSDSARTQLLSGVTSLVAPGALPSRMLATGPNAFVLAIGGGRPAPLIVGGTVDQGRAILVGHEAFLGGDNLNSPSNRQFMQNSLRWLTGKAATDAKIGYIGMGGPVAFAKTAGTTVVPLPKSPAPQDLRGLDALLLSQDALVGDATAQANVLAYIRQGHGLMIAGPAWGWLQLNPGKDILQDYPANRMLLPFGLGFTAGTNDGPYATADSDNPALNGSLALNALLAGTLSADDTNIAVSSVGDQLQLGAGNSQQALSAIRNRAQQEGGLGGPTAAKPLDAKTPFSRLYLRAAATSLPSNAAYPSSQDFPGSTNGLMQESRTVRVDTRVKGWHVTGIYARPGIPVSVLLPASALKLGLSVRIGSHTDELWDLDTWKRYPSISRSWPLTTTRTNVSSPFGGTVYIVVPDSAPATSVVANVGGGVGAVTYVLGETDANAWRGMVNKAGAPWAEMVGNRVALSVPRSSAVKAQDPERLMRHWDSVMAACFDLYSAPPRTTPERYCVDRQISAGYMHSGYPIMTWEDVADAFCDMTKLLGTNGSVWGFYHEVGHNFQRPEWTFDGTGEVTNNLFSLYANEKFNGITPATYGQAQRAMEPSLQMSRLKAYLAKGAKFSDWQSDPFLALTMYSQLREGFGWDPFKAVFKSYWTGPSPQTELEKHDQWMIRFSRQVNRNLAPFFQAWGVPTTESARQSLTDLPTWMPSNWPTP